MVLLILKNLIAIFLSITCYPFHPQDVPNMGDVESLFFSGITIKLITSSKIMDTPNDKK